MKTGEVLTVKQLIEEHDSINNQIVSCDYLVELYTNKKKYLLQERESLLKKPLVYGV